MISKEKESDNFEDIINFISYLLKEPKLIKAEDILENAKIEEEFRLRSFIYDNYEKILSKSPGKMWSSETITKYFIEILKPDELANYSNSTNQLEDLHCN